MRIEVGIRGRDQLSLDLEIQNGKIAMAQLTAIGCLPLLTLIENWRPRLNGELKTIEVPKGTSHQELLLKELLLRAKGEWVLPYDDDELCHCRAIPTRNVCEAIITGCHTPADVSRETSASTACGTCRPDVESLIKYYLQSS